MSAPTALANRIFGELLLRRATYGSEFRRSRLGAASRRDFCDFLDCSQLVRMDLACSRQKDPSPILFQHLLAQASPTYRRVFEIREELGIPFRSTIKSFSRFRLEFDPLAGWVEFPLIKDELYWLASTAPKNVTSEVLKQYRGLLLYSFPVVHDLLHAILNALTPFTPKADLRDYLQYVEALVLPIEGLINTELGHDLYNAIGATGALWARPLPGDRRKVEVRENFEKAILDNIRAKTNYPTPWTRKWMPGYIKRQLELAERSKRGPAHARARLPVVKLARHDLPYLSRNPALMGELWEWYREIFAPFTPKSRSSRQDRSRKGPGTSDGSPASALSRATRRPKNRRG